MSLIHQIAGTTIHGLNDIGITCITNAEYGCIDRIETIKNVVDKYVSNGKIVFSAIFLRLYMMLLAFNRQ